MIYQNQYMTLGVLAAAYRGKNANLKNLRTHTVVFQNNDATDLVGDSTLCGSIRLDHMVDSNGMAPEYDVLREKPTCKRCLKYDPRFIVYATPIVLPGKKDLEAHFYT